MGFIHGVSMGREHNLARLELDWTIEIISDRKMSQIHLCVVIIARAPARSALRASISPKVWNVQKPQFDIMVPVVDWYVDNILTFLTQEMQERFESFCLPAWQISK